MDASILPTTSGWTILQKAVSLSDRPKACGGGALLRLRAAFSFGDARSPVHIGSRTKYVHLTRQIVEAGKLLDIDVLNHLVIGQQRWVSLKERGLGF